MRVLKVWLLVTIVAGAVLGVLSVTDLLDGAQVRELGRMSILSIVVLASSHYAWTVLRGRTNAVDHTDKPVP